MTKTWFLSDETAELRNLLKKESSYICGPNESICFKNLKESVSKAPIFLKFIDINKPTVIQCDSSLNGIGCLVTEWTSYFLLVAFLNRL